MNTEDGVRLPRWQSHKKVWADRIIRIYGGLWFLDCGGHVQVTPDLVARGSPVVGDYFVQYDDGYKSWSPAKAFEEGYTREGAA